MGMITFNGQPSEDYGIIVEHPPDYDTSQKVYNFIKVPGRNGELALASGSYSNITRRYKIALVGDLSFSELSNDLVSWLHSAKGYARLEDSYDEECYRMAIWSDTLSVENILNEAGRTTISFNCKPQRFLKSGETSVIVDKASMIYNPTRFDAEPIIKVYGQGAGTFTLGSYSVSISDIDEFVVVDATIQDVYKNTLNKNGTVTFSKGFPIMIGGQNHINFTGGITKISIVPNWWTL